MTEFISRSYGQDKFEVIIKTDNKEHYKQAEYFSRKLIDHAKPKTNADRIRAMTDEELAKEYDNRIHCGGCPVREKCDKTLDLCDTLLLEWLKQPAE